MDSKQYILVTGVAGFIGFHLSKRLLSDGYRVLGIDCVNDYYDVQLKEDRLRLLREYDGFHFEKFNLMDRERVFSCFQQHAFRQVINLAAQAGVRHSLTHPQDYIDFNLTAFLNVLEACRNFGVEHLIYASSSSVYGANTLLPFSVKQNTDHPVSLYAVSKKANELMAHAYSYNYDIPVTGLRFFSAYGTWGRPDMALFIFMKKILNEETIDVYNHGHMRRDFTYIDDIVECIMRLIPKVPVLNPEWNAADPDPSVSKARYRLFNVGNNSPVQLMHFIRTIERELGKQARINYLPIQTGDVPESYADATELYELINYRPSTSVEEGIHNFVKWYREYYKV